LKSSATVSIENDDSAAGREWFSVELAVIKVLRAATEIFDIAITAVCLISRTNKIAIPYGISLVPAVLMPSQQGQIACRLQRAGK
jgi:hypothetical protein